MPKKFATYPNEFFNQIQKRLGVVNDYQMARALHIDASSVKRIRDGTLNLSAQNLLNIYDQTGWSIEELRSLLYQRIIVRGQWPIIQSSIPDLPIIVKRPEDTADVQRAIAKVGRLNAQIAEPFERKQRQSSY